MPDPQPAATVMIGRQAADGIEFFMLRRSSSSSFMPDVYVFPGGRIEAQDATPEALAVLAGGAALDPAGVHAAVRETFEECGLLFCTTPVDPTPLARARSRLLAGTSSFTRILGDLSTRIDAGALRYFSRWITPPLENRRFDTRFFVARAPFGQAALADAFETHDGVWIAPRDALARYAGGSFALIFPTIKHLERVRDFATIDELLAYAAAKPIHAVTPDIDAARTFAVPPALEGVW